MISNISKIIHPGNFYEFLQSINKNNINGKKEFILSFDGKSVDGKSVGIGPREENLGDVNLWNFEMDPNLKEAKMRLESEEKQFNSLEKFITDKL